MPLAPEDGSAKRIAIRSRDTETREALWQAIAEGCKRKTGVARVSRGEADIAVYLLTAADLADARGAASEIAKDPAPLKYLLEPAGDATTRTKAAPALATLAKVAGTKVLSSESGTLFLSAEEAMQRQVREIVRALTGKPEASEPKPKTKTSSSAKRAAKSEPKKAAPKSTAKKSTKKPGKVPEPAVESAAAEPAPAESLPALEAGAATAQPVRLSEEGRAGKRAAKKAAREAIKPSDEERAARRAAKKAEHEARKSEREAGKSEQAAVPNKRDAKKAAKKAKRTAAPPEERAAMRAERRARIAARLIPSPEERAALRAIIRAKHEARKTVPARTPPKARAASLLSSHAAKRPAGKVEPAALRERHAALRGARRGEPVPVSEERAALRIAKKAGHAARRAEREARKGGRVAPAPEARAAEKGVMAKVSPEERAAKKAAKKAEREANKAVAAAKKPAVKRATPEERAALRAAKKAAKEPAAEKVSATPEERAAKKAERAAAKAEQAAEKPAAEKVSPEERAAKKAAKKAEHEAKKAERAAAKAEQAAEKRVAEKASSEDRAAKKAAKKAEHEAKKAAKKAEHAAKKAERAAAEAEPAAEKPAAEKASPEERAAKKAAKKAEHEAKKTEREARKAELGEEPAAERATPEERAAKKAAKKALATPEERAAKKAAKKAEREAALRAAEEAEQALTLPSPEDDAQTPVAENAQGAAAPAPPGRPAVAVQILRVALVGFDKKREFLLRVALKRAITEAGFLMGGPVSEAGHCHLAIHAFDGLSPAEIAATTFSKTALNPRARAFLECIGGTDEVNHAIAMLACVSGAALLRLNALLRRFAEQSVDQDGLIAEAILAVAVGRLPLLNLPRKRPTAAPPDLAEARAMAGDTNALLAHLRWSGMLPRSIWTPVSKETTEALADGNLHLSPELSIPARLPIDWSMEIEDRRTQLLFHGLDFVAGPLAYFYARAGGITSERITEVDAALKARGSSPSQVLQRAGVLVEDFLAHTSPEKNAKAWQEYPLAARARALALYVLCCKAAAKRKLKYNESACAAAYTGLLDLLEALRSDAFYRPRSLESVSQDCEVIGLALVLRGTRYGAALLAETLERLKTMQLDLGLTADCVWYADSYSVHCQVLSEMTTAFSDFPAAEAAATAPFTAIAKKMSVFSEAMLKSDGTPPVIDDSRQVSYADRLSRERRLIAKASGKQSKGLLKRMTDTYVFRDAQYFISHSSQTIEPDSSLAVLHAEPPSVARGDPGGIVLAFSRGDRDLIVRGKLAERIRPWDDQTPLFAPELRNGYRVDDQGNEPPVLGGEKRARIVKSWRGPGWAAAKSIEDTYASGQIARVVVHLKAANTLIVVDALTGAEEFEQFFNIGKDFVPPDAGSAPLRFSFQPDSVLGVAFTETLDMRIEHAEEQSTLHRHLGPGVTAAVFQWSDGSSDPAVAIRQNGAEEWTVRARGKGFRAEIALKGAELRCELGT